jgi:pimeloyl-ACP methyl ester carboxylesterase
MSTSDLQGAGRLAIDATVGLTNLVENLHQNILRTPGVLGTPSQEPTTGITGLVYRSIRGVTRLVGGSLDALLGQVALLTGPASNTPSAERAAVVAALNGVLGDHLAETANPLATPMRLRRDGHVLELTASALAAALPQATGKVLLLVHGLCMSDRQWQRKGHDHGAALAKAGGFTPVYLRYNSGLHVSVNGFDLARLLETLLPAWPVPVEQLTIIGHSMGGLVARSAVHQGQAAGMAWAKSLRAMVFLGTPHHGAPLERGGHWIDVILGANPYTAAFARLGKVRSAGITDLRHGSLVEADWAGADRFAHGHDQRQVVGLPVGVDCYAIAASLSSEPGGLQEKLLGDGLVPVASALGQHAHQARRCLAFPPGHQWVGYDMNHLDLLGSPEVGAQIEHWLVPG